MDDLDALAEQMITEARAAKGSGMRVAIRHVHSVLERVAYGFLSLLKLAVCLAALLLIAALALGLVLAIPVMVVALIRSAVGWVLVIIVCAAVVVPVVAVLEVVRYLMRIKMERAKLRDRSRRLNLPSDLAARPGHDSGASSS